MRTMIDVKKCGSIKSMRQTVSRPYEDKSIPHLSLYVHHMNKTKLLKEKVVLMGRLDEIEKQLKYENDHIVSLRPKLGLPEAKRGRGRPRKYQDDGHTGKHGRKKKFSKMKMSF